MLPHQFQRVALAGLLCTNSPLGIRWRKGAQVSKEQLVGLGFSDDFAAEAADTMSKVADDDRILFDPLAVKLQAMFWTDLPPHPPATVERGIAGLVRAEDDRQPAA